RYSLTFGLNAVGPDGFGYSAAVYPFESLELVGQPGVFTIIAGGDDSAAAVNLGSNSFNFYGQTYTGATALYVSTNGLITFGSSNTSYSNSDLTTSPSQSAIAALWDDLITGPGNPMVLGKFRDLNTDGTPDQLIIEWNQVYHYSS